MRTLKCSISVLKTATPGFVEVRFREGGKIRLRWGSFESDTQDTIRKAQAEYLKGVVKRIEKGEFKSPLGNVEFFIK